MTWFDAGTNKMSVPPFGNFFEINTGTMQKDMGLTTVQNCDRAGEVLVTEKQMAMTSSWHPLLLQCCKRCYLNLFASIQNIREMGWQEGGICLNWQSWLAKIWQSWQSWKTTNMPAISCLKQYEESKVWQCSTKSWNIPGCSIWQPSVYIPKVWQKMSKFYSKNPKTEKQLL